MVLHATVEKLTTWKALLLLSQAHCPRKYPFSPKVASRKVQSVNVLNDMTPPTPTVLRQAKEPGRTQSRLIRITISHILQNQSLRSLAQARCCLKQLRCPATRQTHILPSPWVLNIALLMVYQPTSPFLITHHTLLPRHICTIQVLRRRQLIRLLSCSNQSYSMATRGTPQPLTAVIHRKQDTEPNMGIIRTILHRPHHMGIPLISGRRILGIPHSPCQLGIIHRPRRLLLLSSLNMEEVVKFPMGMVEGKPPKVQLNI